MLLNGRFRPGERIREVPLAAQLRVSRIPLRLALERLAHEGFLQMRPTRGFLVQQFSIVEAIANRERLRAEMFNIFNHANWGLPNAQVFVQTPGTGGGTYNPIAGRITTLASPMRQIQFALKLIF